MPLAVFNNQQIFVVRFWLIFAHAMLPYKRVCRLFTFGMRRPNSITLFFHLNG